MKKEIMNQQLLKSMFYIEILTLLPQDEINNGVVSFHNQNSITKSNKIKSNK